MRTVAAERRILVAVVTRATGEWIQAWRERHDPEQARRLPPHTTLGYRVPKLEPEALANQVRHAFAGGVTVQLGGVRAFDNAERTIYIAMHRTAALDTARRRLYGGRFVRLPGYGEWTWHVSCVRRSHGRDVASLLQQAHALESLGAWTVDRVDSMELHGRRYESLTTYWLS